MAKLVVHLLGGYRVELDDQAVYDFETDKARALLAYLCVEAGRPHRRETLASLLWPDRPDTVARANLRQALSRVRRALREADHEPPPFLFVTLTDVQFNAASDHTLDVAELEAFARSPARHRQLLPEAFCGDFLAGFGLPDSEAFQAWVLSKQEHCHRLAIEILDEQNAAFEGMGDFEQAAAAARLQLRLEPWLEEAHRRMMRALALAGRRDEALRQYGTCRRVLRIELGLEPAGSTQALYADIRAGRLVVAAGPVRSVTSEVGPGTPGSPPALPARQPDLPIRLVARGDEMGRLSRHLDAALAGETQVVFISGDRGSGKTALLEAFAASALAQHPDLLLVGARCSPGGALDPFAPLLRVAGMLFGNLEGYVAGQMIDRESVDRLQRATGLLLSSLGEHGLDLIDTLVPAASIARRAASSPIGDAAKGPAWRTALDDKHAPKPSAVISQGALVDRLIGTLAAVSRRQPLLVVFDDLQWVDDATAAFLLGIGGELAGSRVLVLAAYRSGTVALGRRDPQTGGDLRHPLAAAINELRRRQGEITVDLDRADGRAFVEAYVDAEPNRLGARFRDALYAQTGGHALFTVESLRNLEERGEIVQDEAGRWTAPESLDWGALPARVEAAIGERIDRLPEREHRILSCASVEGDEFTAEVLARVTGAAVTEVVTCLSGSLARQHHLVRPEALRRLPHGQRSIYRFTHHLFQKYLYGQLDPVERAELHEAVGLGLEALLGAEAGGMAVKLARHFEAAGLLDKAAGYSLQAGSRAMEVSAHHEAVQHYRRGLALLSGLPDSSERDGQELDLQLALGSALLTTDGMGSQGQIVAYSRAYELSQRLGERAALWPALHALASSSTARGQYQKALELGDQLLALAQRSADSTVLALAHFTLGATLFSSGISLVRAREHLEQAFRYYDSDCDSGSRRFLTSLNLFDLGVNARAWLANVLWILGYPDQALLRSQEALASAQQIDHFISRVLALYAAGHAFQARGDEQALWEPVQALERLVRGKHLLVGEVWVEVFSGWLLVRAGQVEEGLARMRQGVEAWLKTGAVFGATAQLSLLAEACLLAGKTEEGLEAAERALALVERTGARPNEAELHRLRGELLLARGDEAQALQCFERAIELAHAGEQKRWELRAATSLARLRQREDSQAEDSARREEARALLAGVYEWFTEGLDTPDMQAARALLAQW